MKRNAIIKEIAYYHPETVIDNEYYINHFKKQGKNIEGLLKATGRDKRYIATNPEENIIEMGYRAAVKVLKKAHIKASSLSMIVFATGTPEYISPTNALQINAMLEAGQKCGVYDINANCSGALVALDQVSRSMQSNPNMKYVLLVASDQINRFSRYEEAMTYSNFGDAACALLLENVSETDRGIIDTDYYTNSSNFNKIFFPAKGLSSVLKDRSLSTRDKLLQWIDFKFDGAFKSAHISINDLLFRNNITKTNVKKYCISQFALNSIKGICEDLKEDINKFTFVGDEFGYTGNTSPLLAYARAVENNELQVGDNIIFWTVGAGTNCVCILYRQ